MDIKNITRILGLFICSRIIILGIVLLVSPQAIASFLDIPPQRVVHNHRQVDGINDFSVLDKFAYSTDSIVYIGISRAGYQGFGETREYRFFGSCIGCSESMHPPGFSIHECSYLWAFGYPALIRFFSWFMGVKVSALAVSNTASLISCFLIYIISRDYLDSGRAMLATGLYMFFPHNLVFHTAGFAEPVFMVFVLLSWISFKRGLFFSAGLLVLLSFFTRYPGILLFLVYPLILFRKNFIGKTVLDSSKILLSAIPAAYWILMHVPDATGYSFSMLEKTCEGNRLGIPGIAILQGNAITLFYAYILVFSLVRMRGWDKSLWTYSLLFFLMHASVSGPAAVSLSRYFGSIWPLFIFFAGKLERPDVVLAGVFYSVILIIVAVMHMNFVGFI